MLSDVFCTRKILTIVRNFFKKSRRTSDKHPPTPPSFATTNSSNIYLPRTPSNLSSTSPQTPLPFHTRRMCQFWRLSTYDKHPSRLPLVVALSLLTTLTIGTKETMQKRRRRRRFQNILRIRFLFFFSQIRYLHVCIKFIYLIEIFCFKVSDKI